MAPEKYSAMGRQFIAGIPIATSIHNINAAVLACIQATYSITSHHLSAIINGPPFQSSSMHSPSAEASDVHIRV